MDISYVFNFKATLIYVYSDIHISYLTTEIHIFKTKSIKILALSVNKAVVSEWII